MSPPEPDLALQDAISRIKQICLMSNGRSQYFPYGGTGYRASVTHYFESSTEVAVGAVQPGSEDDLAEIIKVIADTHVKFGVRCGGHSSNPGFSSTEGIQICLSRLHQIVVDKPNMRVRVGAGCLFEELYQVLDPYNINIVGATGISGVGVSGWMLGGGYSVKTSQHGLGIDNIVSVRVVLPDGTIKVANDMENPELFFAIKGGGNNFGIVSEFTLKAHPQGEFHYRMFMYELQYSGEVRAAIMAIIKRQDEKANMLALFQSTPGESGPSVALIVHSAYDGNFPTSDPFQELIDIPHKIGATGHHPVSGKTSSFLQADLLRSHHNGTYNLLSDIPRPAHYLDGDRPQPPMAGIGQFPRGRWGNVMVNEFTPCIIEEMEKEFTRIAKEVGKNGGALVTIAMWPFTTSMFDNATSSAFPHERDKPNFPVKLHLIWEGAKNDAHWINIMKSTLERLSGNVQNEASKTLPNMITTTFSETTTVEDLYRDNLPKLKELRRMYDPTGVMDRTGGFKIPLE